MTLALSVGACVTTTGDAAPGAGDARLAAAPTLYDGITNAGGLSIAAGQNFYVIFAFAAATGISAYEVWRNPTDLSTHSTGIVLDSSADGVTWANQTFENTGGLKGTIGGAALFTAQYVRVRLYAASGLAKDGTWDVGTLGVFETQLYGTDGKQLLGPAPTASGAARATTYQKRLAALLALQGELLTFSTVGARTGLVRPLSFQELSAYFSAATIGGLTLPALVMTLPGTTAAPAVGETATRDGRVLTVKAVEAVRLAGVVLSWTVVMA